VTSQTFADKLTVSSPSGVSQAPARSEMSKLDASSRVVSVKTAPLPHRLARSLPPQGQSGSCTVLLTSSSTA